MATSLSPALPLRSAVAAVSAYGGMRGLIESALALAAQSVDGVLAVLVETSGSASRKQGAMGLYAESGHVAGALAGGTLQQRLHEAARTVLANGKAIAVTLDSRQDSSHTAMEADRGGGILHILLLPLPSRAAPLRDALGKACTSSAWLRLRLELGDDGERNVSFGAGEARIGQEMFAFDNHGSPCAFARHFVRHVSLTFAPPPRLALLGSGVESLTIVRLVHLLGWYVEIVDARAGSLGQAASRDADQLHRHLPDDLPELLAERHFDAAIIGGNDFEIDLGYLRHLATAGIGYIGLLGPPERRDTFLTRLGDIIATQLEPRLYAPAGLRLGGDGPEVIALAVVAQLQYYLAHDAHA